MRNSYKKIILLEILLLRNHVLIPSEKHTMTQWSISRLYFPFLNTSQTPQAHLNIAY